MHTPIRHHRPRRTAHGILALLLCATSAIATTPSSATLPEPISLPAFQALARPQPDHELRYGDAQVQAIDVFVPTGAGPHPVAILIHGGCWRAFPGAGREQLRHLGAELARDGIASWSVGYRRVDDAGGGFPGTYLDVAQAIDRLRDEASRLALDLDRLVVVGHSAGGHLALWSAGRDRIATQSPLASKQPLLPQHVISLAGIGDLEAFARMTNAICGAQVNDTLVGAGEARAAPYADTSPSELVPSNASIELISGEYDRLVPPYAALDYAQAMQRAGRGDRVRLTTIEGVGHFDLVTPGGPAWSQVRERIDAALRIAE